MLNKCIYTLNFTENFPNIISLFVVAWNSYPPFPDEKIRIKEGKWFIQVCKANTLQNRNRTWEFLIHVMGSLTYPSCCFNWYWGHRCLGPPFFNVKGRIQFSVSPNNLQFFSLNFSLYFGWECTHLFIDLFVQQALIKLWLCTLYMSQNRGYIKVLVRE